jgi:FG-GAP repeat protein
MRTRVHSWRWRLVTGLSTVTMLVASGEAQFSAQAQATASALRLATVNPNFSGALDATAVATGDVNGDGFQDVVVVNGCGNDLFVCHGSVGILLGNGDGTLQTPATQNLNGFSRHGRSHRRSEPRWTPGSGGHRGLRDSCVRHARDRRRHWSAHGHSQRNAESPNGRRAHERCGCRRRHPRRRVCKQTLADARANRGVQ